MFNMSMSLQEIFDVVWNGINSQGGASAGGWQHPRCKYRNAEGRKCAVGWLIPDELYDPEMERMDGAAVIHSAGLSEIFSGNLTHIAKLQAMHDSVILAVLGFEDYSNSDVKFLSMWRQRMKKYAADNGLEVPGEYDNE